MSAFGPRPSRRPYPTHPLHYFLVLSAARLPDKVAVYDGSRAMTYRHLLDASTRFASSLHALGVGKGDRVALMAFNCLEVVIAFNGISMAGAVVTPLNPSYRQKEVAHQLADSGAKMLIVQASLLGVARDAMQAAPSVQRLVSIGADTATQNASRIAQGRPEQPPFPLEGGRTKDGGAPPPRPRLHTFADLLDKGGSQPPQVSIDPAGDLMALPYSSGTTGLPKGVMLTHANLVTNLSQYLGVGGAGAPREDDTFLACLPLFHIYGMNLVMNAAIARGATLVVMPRFDLERALALIRQHGVTMLHLVPPMVLALNQCPDAALAGLSSVRVAYSGAAPLSGELQELLEARAGIRCAQAYGLTETSPLDNIDFAEPDRQRRGSVGPPLPDTEEKVVDLETGERELPPGEVGELAIRGPQVMQGYWNNPEATARMIRNGWLHTGDIARMDADGWVYVVDRMKDLIKYKGFQVAPAELEAALLEHPAVKDAAVIGKPDAEAGEVPKAFVVAKSAVTAADLQAHIEARLAHFKRIREVEFVAEIPKSPSGKILRRVLLERERTKP